MMSNTAFKRDIDDPQTIVRFRGAGAIARAAEAAAAADRRRYPRGRAQGVERLEGGLAARALSRARGVMTGGASAECAAMLVAHRRGQIRCAAAARIQRRGIRRLLPRRARLHRSTGCRSMPRRIARHARLMREADRSGAPLTVETRVDPPARSPRSRSIPPTIRACSRASPAPCGQRRQHRRRQDLHHDQRHGARHVLAPGRGGRRLRPPGQARALAVLFENVLTGRSAPHGELARPQAFPSRTSVFTVTPRVLIDNKASPPTP
jgi:[protein-PII] uridylyltransferase